MTAQTAHAYSYANVAPDASNYDTTLYQALLEQYGAATILGGPSISTPSHAPSLAGSFAQASLTTGPSYANVNLFTTLAQVLAQSVVPVLDEPRTPNKVPVIPRSQSVSESSEPVPYAYGRELSEVRTGLHQRRGSDAQEQFMFDIVAPFIEKFGMRALHDIDLTLEAMPRSAKYFFPYLLGHLEHEETFERRFEMLMCYRESTDEDVRDGALEALGFLDAS